jgi:hypothetical protein
MSVHDEQRSRAVFISPDIRKFQGVEDISEYLKIKARLRRSGPDGANHGILGGIMRWRHSWSTSENKLGIIIAITGIVAALVAIATLVVTFLSRLRSDRQSVTPRELVLSQGRRRAHSGMDVPRRADSSYVRPDPAV